MHSVVLPPSFKRGNSSLRQPALFLLLDDLSLHLSDSLTVPAQAQSVMSVNICIWHCSITNCTSSVRLFCRRRNNVLQPQMHPLAV